MKYQETNESLELDFIPGKDNPEAIYNSIQLMFSHIIMFQTEVLKKVDPLIDIEFLLLNIRTGSIFSDYVKQILVPDSTDEALACPEPKGDLFGYLDGAQNAIIDVAENDPGSILDNDALQDIYGRIKDSATTSSVIQNPNFRDPNKIVIAESIELLEKSMGLLSSGENYYFDNDRQRKQLGKVYTKFDKDELRKEMAGKIVESPIHIKIKVKIADFLGKSRWKFKLANGKTIEAKILDESWLTKFHAKNVVIGPGDAIEVEGVVKDIFDDYGKLIDSEYTITKVVKIHAAENQRQIDF